ncbi:hypothetical protein [Streptomyces bacillaris]|uniref:hypothetical protein n=1 Tax=Streptomyces bacillaris TaxID=68179 RepID=UPI00364552E6
MRTHHHFIVRTANDAIADEAQARATYMTKLASPAAIDANDLAPVLAASCYASPWRKVLTLTRTRPLIDAVDAARDHALQVLIERGETRSTSALTNEHARQEREGLRRFLDQTTSTIGRLKRESDEQCTRGGCAVCPAPAPACDCGGCASCMG